MYILHRWIYQAAKTIHVVFKVVRRSKRDVYCQLIELILDMCALYVNVEFSRFLVGWNIFLVVPYLYVVQSQFFWNQVDTDHDFAWVSRFLVGWNIFLVVSYLYVVQSQFFWDQVDTDHDFVWVSRFLVGWNIFLEVSYLYVVQSIVLGPGGHRPWLCNTMDVYLYF